MKIEVSNAEILDKFAILSIKLQQITIKNKIANIRTEHAYLHKIYEQIIKENKNIISLYNQYQNISILDTNYWKTEILKNVQQ